LIADLARAFTSGGSESAGVLSGTEILR